jgi:hypothetical protein
MENRFDELFFKNHSSYKRDLEKKVSWRCYALGVLFGVIAAMALILLGIFCSSFTDSMISLFFLSIQ